MQKQLMPIVDQRDWFRMGWMNTRNRMCIVPQPPYWNPALSNTVGDGFPVPAALGFVFHIFSANSQALTELT